MFIKLKYLEIPLTLRLRTNEIGYITYWVQVGVGLGFNIKARATDEIDHKKIDVATAGNPLVYYKIVSSFRKDFWKEFINE